MRYGYLYVIALRSVVKMRHLCIYGNRNTCTRSPKKPKEARIRPVFISCLSVIKLPLQRVYYSLAVWRFKTILSASLRFHSHLSGGLRLRNYRAVVGNHKFRGFRFLRVFVAVIQTELRGSEDLAVTLSCLKLLSLTKDCLLELD